MLILELVAQSEPTGIRFVDVVNALELSKSSALGFLRGLTFCGYLVLRDGRYRQGPAMALLSGSRGGFPAEFRHALEDLSETSRETAVLAVMNGDFFLHVNVVEPKEVVRVSLPLNQRNPMWPGSYGKVFVAFMSPARRRAYLRRRHQMQSECRHILDEVEMIQERGVALNRGESIADVYGVASPVVVHHGEVKLAIGVTGPACRMRDRLDEMAESVLRVSRQLSDPGTVRNARLAD